MFITYKFTYAGYDVDIYLQCGFAIYKCCNVNRGRNCFRRSEDKGSIKFMYKKLTRFKITVNFISINLYFLMFKKEETNSLLQSLAFKAKNNSLILSRYFLNYLQIDFWSRNFSNSSVKCAITFKPLYIPLNRMSKWALIFVT